MTAGLAGKVALISGGTGASGASIGRSLADRGAAVVICGRSTEAGEQVSASINADGGRAIYVPVDIAYEHQVAAAVEEAQRRFGRLDVVVNNAAALDQIRGGHESPVTTCPTEVFDYMLRVGLFGPFWLFKYAIPEMLAAGGGAFVSVTSIVAVQAVPNRPAYSASKAALESLSRQVCADYGARGIRSNVIRLGNMMVPANAARFSDPAQAETVQASIMTTRVGTPDDLAAAVTFLADTSSGYINGAVLPLDGGSTVFAAGLRPSWGKPEDAEAGYVA